MAKPSTDLGKIAHQGELRDHPILNHQFLFFDFSGTSNGGGKGQPKDRSVIGSNADEWVILGDGDDVVMMGGGDDLVEASAGADFLFGGGNGAFGDTISYASWDGAVIVDFNGPIFPGDPDAQGDMIGGFENVIGSSFSDTIFGNFAANTLYGGDGDDVIRGENINSQFFNPLPPTRFAADDTIYGGAGADVLYGDADAGGATSFLDGSSTTTIFGGDDTIYGGADNDSIIGDGDVSGRSDGTASTMNGGDDTLFGGEGNDSIVGDGRGLAALSGDSAIINGGADTIDGGAGDDDLWGDSHSFGVSLPGNPTIINGGADTFVFAPGGEADRIMDFRQSDGDLLDVSAHGITSITGLTILEDPTNASNTIVEFGGGDQVTLVGFVDQSLLGAGDFIFATV